jgi:predicted RND superfamily exporter protein
MRSRYVIYTVMICTIPVGFWLGSLLPFASDVAAYNLAAEEDIKEYRAFIDDLGMDTNSQESIIVLEHLEAWQSYADFLLLDSLTSFWTQQSGIDKVLSITNLPYPRRGVFGPVSTPFLNLEDPTAFAQRMKNLDAYPDIFEKFLSPDQRYALLFLYNEQSLAAAEATTFRELPILKNKVKVHFVQYDLIQKEMETTMERDTLFLALISLMFILAGFYFYTRSLSGLALIGLAVLFNISLTFIAMYMLDMAFTLHMVTIPAIIIVLSFTDIMHLIYHQHKEVKHAENSASLQGKILEKVKTPLLLTSLTNMVGFVIFLAFSNNIHLQNFSLAAILGVGFAYLSSRFLIIRLMNPDFLFIRKKEYTRLLMLHSKLGNFIFKNRKSVLSIFVVLLLIPGYWVSRYFTFDNADASYQIQDSSANKGATILQKDFFGSKQAEVFISIKKGNIWEPEYFQKLSTLENEIDSLFAPLFISSPLVLAKRYHRFINYGQPEAYIVPSDVDTSFLKNVASAKVQLGASGVMDSTSTKARILFGYEGMDLENARSAYASLSNTAESISDENISFQLSGLDYLSDEATFYFSQKILMGLLAGILVGSLLVYFFLRSWRKSLGVLLVNLLPMILALGILEWWSIPVSPLSLFFLSILLGICIDDSIYIIMQYKGGERQIHVLPVFITSVVLGLGFLSLAFSSFLWIQPFGWIFLSGILVAYVLDLFVLPLFLNRKVIFGADG